MKVFDSSCTIRTETLGSDLNGKGDEYRDIKYEIVSNDQGTLIIRVFSSLAGGIRYSSGSVDIVDNDIYLHCITRTSDTIEFELLAWEVTFTIDFDGELIPDKIYFQDKLITNPA